MRTPAWVALCGALALLFVYLCVPSAASAKQLRLFTGGFGAASSITSDPYPLDSPWSVAVDNSAGPSHGDVYVSDGQNHRVEKFDSSGNLLLMFGKEVNKGKIDEGGKTEAEQNLCAAAEECQPGTVGTTPGAFGGGANGEPGIMWVAVDSSSGDLYVADFSDATVTKFDEGGQIVSSWATAGQLSGNGIESFAQIVGMAVDPASNLWVEDRPAGSSGKVFEFEQDSTFTGNSWPISLQVGGGIPIAGTNGFAADGEEHLYLEAGAGGSTWKISAAGAEIGLVTEAGAGGTEGLAVDPRTGDLYVDANLGGGTVEINRYDVSCHPLPDPGFQGCAAAESFASPHLSSGDPRALAIDSSAAAKPLYVGKLGAGEVATFSIETVPDVTTAKASGFTLASTNLGGTVDPAGVAITECFFEWGETESYGEFAACEPNAATIGEGNSPVAVHAQIPVQPGHTYHFRLVAANANDANSLIDEPERGQDLSFGPPRIDSTSASEVTATSAVLLAEINPENVAAAYRFEYLTEADYLTNGKSFAGPDPAAQIPVPDAALGSGGGDVTASQHLQGLQPQTAYLYRVIAKSSLAEGPEAVLGPLCAFATQAPGLFALPDARAWEQVSPRDKHGALIEPIGSSYVQFAAIQAAAEGSAISYVANAPIQSGPQGYVTSTQLFSIRGPGGWSSSEIAVPHSAATGLPGGTTEVAAFSTDLSRAAVQPFGAFQPTLSSAATEQTAYFHRDFAPGEPGQPCASSCFLPLVTAANTPPATKFGEEGKCPPQSPPFCGPQFLGASPDLSHVILESHVGLTETPGDKGGLYEWSAGLLSLVSQGPAGIATSCGGGGPLCAPVPVGQAVLGGGAVFADRRQAVAADGSRVLWSSRLNKHLYVRDTATEETIQLDVPFADASGAGAVAPIFQTASADGSRVFFTDEQALTADSGAQAGKADLYECRLEAAEAAFRCDLTDLTPAAGAESAEVMGLVPGASEDGSYVYFVANGVLNPGASPGDCPPNSGEDKLNRSCNLYLRHAGATTFIARLSAADSPDWAKGNDGSLPTLTSRVSPNGEWYAFMSSRSLTGYDNRDVLSAQPDEEVYLYHAAATGPATLTCVSCNPTGARPHGVQARENGVEPNLPLAAPTVWGQGDWLAANLLPWTTALGQGDGIYQPRYLSDSGRLFFNSTDALVSKDVNGRADVYQYEPEAVGSCTASTASGSEVFKPARSLELEGREVSEGPGCLALISSGASPDEAAFLDASESGTDVFFLTATQLSTRDSDHSIDVYDARSGGGFPEPLAPVPCTGDACQLPAVPSNHPTPGTALLNGPGNVTECPKGKQLKRGKCVARKHKTKHHQRKRGTQKQAANNHQRSSL